MSSQPPSLPPVPAPWHRRWREFRIQALPFLPFVLVGTLAATLWHLVVLPQSIDASNSGHCAASLDRITVNDDAGRRSDTPPPSSQTNGIVDFYSPRD